MSSTSLGNDANLRAPAIVGGASKVDIVRLPGAIGAEVRCDVRALDKDGAEKIYQAYLENLALVFRGQELSDDDLMDFGRLFGDLMPPLPPEHAAAGSRTLTEDYPLVSIVSNVKENGIAIGNLGDGEAQWHSDFSFHPVPCSASILYAVELPQSWGGDTSVLNMYAALEALPKELRRLVEGMTVKNDLRYDSVGGRRSGVEDSDDLRTSPGPSHPIVRTNPDTGYNALYIGRRANAYLNGLPVEESEEILDELWSYADNEDFAYRNSWQVGDILMWDNRCTMHHRQAFDPNSRRIMHRVQTYGERPFYAPRSSKPGPHPRSVS